MKQKNNQRLGTRSAFTLIEILIVVAIIAILASVVLIGLGPTQQLGRDARRLSDLREVQTGLELYYGDCGYYPGSPTGSSTCPAFNQVYTWGEMSTALTGSPIGIPQVPLDPTNSGSHIYHYGTTDDGSSYVIAATLEDANNSAFASYQPLSLGGYTATGLTSCTPPNYCLSL